MRKMVPKRDLLGCCGCDASGGSRPPCHRGRGDEGPPTDHTFHDSVSQGKVSVCREGDGFLDLSSQQPVGFGPNRTRNTILCFPPVSVPCVGHVATLKMLGPNFSWVLMVVVTRW